MQYSEYTPEIKAMLDRCERRLEIPYAMRGTMHGFYLGLMEPWEAQDLDDLEDVLCAAYLEVDYGIDGEWLEYRWQPEFFFKNNPE